jgi:predicted ribosomally synthesized peptide with SipW-like signal peptide
MAYTYKKLTDVELVESAVEPNLLIEDGGDIKKISASNIAVPQVNADWDEEDIESPAFIMNKPDLSEVGGGANVVTYTIVSGALMLDGVATTAQSVVDEWNNGSILRIDATTTTGGSLGSVVGISYTLASGAIAGATLSYYSDTMVSSVTI